MSFLKFCLSLVLLTQVFISCSPSDRTSPPDEDKPSPQGDLPPAAENETQLTPEPEAQGPKISDSTLPLFFDQKPAGPQNTQDPPQVEGSPSPQVLTPSAPLSEESSEDLKGEAPITSVSTSSGTVKPPLSTNEKPPSPEDSTFVSPLKNDPEALRDLLKPRNTAAPQTKSPAPSSVPTAQKPTPPLPAAPLPPTPFQIPTTTTSTPPVLNRIPPPEEKPPADPSSVPLPESPVLAIIPSATSTPPVLNRIPPPEEKPPADPSSVPLPESPVLTIIPSATSTPPVLNQPPSPPTIEEEAQPPTTVPLSEEKPDTPPPHPELSLSPLQRDTALQLCHFPPALTKAVERKFSKKCQNISPEEIATLTRLKLKINDEEGRLIKPHHFLPFLSLTALDLSHNRHITFLPEFVTTLPLHTLDVSSTGIKDFGHEVENMNQLQVLVASYNSYKNNEIPLPIFEIENLKALDVSYSGLRYIDEHSIFLQELEELHLQGNKLVQLPALIYLMPKLLLVDLRDNQFKDKGFMIRHSCIEAENQKECQQDMLAQSGFTCGWRYEYPYQRGEPARRFRVMTDEEFDHYATNGRPNRDICLSWHLYQETLKENHPTREFLNKTVNGKTIREWRMVVDFHNNDNKTDLIFPLMAFSPSWWRSPYTHCVWTQKGYFKLTGIIWPTPTDFLPKVQEAFPERYPPRAKTPSLPEECKDYQYLSSDDNT